MRALWTTRRALAVLALPALLLLSPVPGLAIPMFQGDSINVIFPAPGGNTNLAADATISLTALTSSSATFSVNLHNGTILDLGARITAFGFDLSPTPTADPAIAVFDTGGLSDTDAFIQGDTPDNIPSLNAENVCFWTGSNCSGGGGTGLTDGQRDLFGFSLSGSFGGSIDISAIGIKWQGCEGCSFEVQGDLLPRLPVPEPASVTLLGIGVIAAAALGWRKRKAQQ